MIDWIMTEWKRGSIWAYFYWVSGVAMILSGVTAGLVLGLLTSVGLNLGLALFTGTSVGISVGLHVTILFDMED